MGYKQLIEGQRYQIQAYLQQGFSQSQIARQIGVNKSTVCRELRRNRLCDEYQPGVAQELAFERRQEASKYRIPEQTREYVEMMLTEDWSPEQIAQVGKRIGHPVSHEWIYRYVARNRAWGGQLYRHLRQGHKRYRKGKQSKRSVIPSPVYIDDRPAIVEERSRVGDWEVDTVMGKQGCGAIVSLAERKSRLYLVRKLPSKNASDVADAMIDMLKPYPVLTITADNGSEFVEHQRVAESLDAEFYFAHPYASWQRGQNENSNGLLRQYVPKGTDLRKVTDEQLQAYQNRINLRPKKCLGFKQPLVVFNQLISAA